MSRMADVYYELTEAVIAYETKKDKQPLQDIKAKYGADIYDADVYDRILIENGLA
jgi:hypothetical protein